MKKKILVTGSSGFIGKSIINDFEIDDNIYLFKTTRDKEKINNNTLYLDLINKDSINNLFIDNNFNTIIHLGGCSSPISCEEAPEHSHKVNVLGTLQLANKAKKNKIGCFINFSSNKSINPKSIYGKQKQKIEKELLKLSSSDFNCISYRCGNILKSPNSFLFEWNKMYKNDLRVKSSGKDIFRYFISLDNVKKDLEIINFNQKQFQNCIVVPEMKEGEIYTFLKIFTEFHQAKLEIIPNRKIDNLKDFIINKSELNNIKIKSIDNRTFGLINKSFENIITEKISKVLVSPLNFEEIKSIIKSIN